MTGKHLLMLGTNVGSTDMVAYAQSMGHRVTVTDYLPDDAGAKKIADATASVSTIDVPALIEYARAHDVDAVLAGVNEGNLRSAIAVSEELGLPFYCTSAQWDRLMDKGQFRELCIAEDMPHPATYFSGPGSDFSADDVELRFPLVVKPVDGSSLRGITICQDAASLAQAVEAAVEASRHGDILLEAFVEGEEFTAAYVVVDGKVSLSSIDVRYPFAFDGMTTTFPVLRVYPPTFAQEYIDACDEAVRRVCAAVGLRNACVFFQGIKGESGFAIFEAGLRMAGEAPYRFLDTVNGVNPMKHLVDTIVDGRGAYDVSCDDPFLGGEVCAIASFIYRAGTVAEIRGLDAVLSEIPEIIDWESRYAGGDIVRADGTLRQVGLRFILRCADRERLRAVIDGLSGRIDILDETGESMAVAPAAAFEQIDEDAP